MLPVRDQLPTRRPSYVNYTLILCNVLAFFYENALLEAADPRFLHDWGLVPSQLVARPEEEAITILSSMFLHAPAAHGGWAHLGGNMLFLWIFGDNVEDALGSGRYLVFYLLAGVAAAFAQVATDPASTVPMVGASGAISGVLAAYGSLYPRSPITVLNPIPLLWLWGIFIQLPAWVIILEYFVVNLLSGIGSLGRQGGGVAFFAHLGGFVAGILLVRVFMIGREPREHDRWHGWRPSRRPTRAPYGYPPPRDRDPWRF